MKDEELVKEQMKTISRLQDKINLLQFDIIENSKEKRLLKGLMLRRKKTNINAIKSLEEMKRNNNFDDIDKVIFMLKKSYDREHVDYEE